MCIRDSYYGAGVLTVFAFYIFRGRKWWCLLGQVLTLYWINVVLMGGLMYPIRLFGMELSLIHISPRSSPGSWRSKNQP